jgi:hypothetical protein
MGIEAVPQLPQWKKSSSLKQTISTFCHIYCVQTSSHIKFSVTQPKQLITCNFYISILHTSLPLQEEIAYCLQHVQFTDYTTRSSRFRTVWQLWVMQTA